MNKKLIAIIVVVILAVSAIFLFKSCKNETTTSEADKRFTVDEEFKNGVKKSLLRPSGEGETLNVYLPKKEELEFVTGSDEFYVEARVVNETGEFIPDGELSNFFTYEEMETLNFEEFSCTLKEGQKLSFYISEYENDKEELISFGDEIKTTTIDGVDFSYMSTTSYDDENGKEVNAYYMVADYTDSKDAIVILVQSEKEMSDEELFKVAGRLESGEKVEKTSETDAE